MLKKMFGFDPLSKVFKEFKTIKELQAKNEAFKSKIEEQEDGSPVETYKDIIATQTEMLNNNFRNLARVFEIENQAVKTKFKLSNPTSLFNFKTTSPIIHCSKLEGYSHFREFKHVNTGEVVTNKEFYAVDGMCTHYINFELGFKRVLDNIPNVKVRSKVEKQMVKKIHKKINEYCDSLGENAEAVRKYIFSNVGDHFFNLEEFGAKFLPEIISRFNAMVNFDLEMKATNQNVIKAKDFLTINNDNFSNNMLSFLNEYNNPNHDYILLNNHWDVG